MWWILKLHCEAFGFFRCLVEKEKKGNEKAYTLGIMLSTLASNRMFYFYPLDTLSFYVKEFVL